MENYIQRIKASENEMSFKWSFNYSKHCSFYKSLQLRTTAMNFGEIGNCYVEATYMASNEVMKFQLLNYNDCYKKPTISGARCTFMIYNPYQRVNIMVLEENYHSKDFQNIFEYNFKGPKYSFGQSKLVFDFEIKFLKPKLISFMKNATSLKNDTCDIKAPSVPLNEETKNSCFVDDPGKLKQDFRCLYTSGIMSDLKICIGEKTLHAHKLILCTRSPVFKKMMEHNCLESSSNTITITDCSPTIFDKFLKYMYTGEIEDTFVDTVVPLYSLGDKYDVSPLREACSCILKEKLTSETVDNVADIVCEILQLAECHNDLELKELATNFIVSHFPKVSNRQSWKDLMKSNSELTSDVLARVVTACQNNKF